jgi:ribosomal protein L37AE/L43A
VSYIKPKCQYCDGYAKADIYPVEPNDKISAIFYCTICPTCKDPIIIYRYHSEPSDVDIKTMLDWANSNFKYRVPDFERLHVLDHFSFEMRANSDAVVDIPHRKTLLRCVKCNELFTSEEMDKCEEGLWVCKKCLMELPHASYEAWLNSLIGEPSNLSRTEAQYEHIQLMDMDDDYEEGAD